MTSSSRPMMMKATHAEHARPATSAISTPDTSSLSAVVSRKLPERGRLLPAASEPAVEEVGERGDREQGRGGGDGPLHAVAHPGSTPSRRASGRSRRYVMAGGTWRLGRRRWSPGIWRIVTAAFVSRPAARGPRPRTRRPAPSRPGPRPRRCRWLRTACFTAPDRGSAHREFADAEAQQQRRGGGIARELAADPDPAAMRPCGDGGGLDEPEHRWVQRVGQCRDVFVAAIGGEHVLRQVVRADREEVDRGCERRRGERCGGHLHHDADLELACRARRPVEPPPAASSARRSSSAVATMGNITRTGKSAATRTTARSCGRSRSGRASPNRTPRTPRNGFGSGGWPR